MALDFCPGPHGHVGQVVTLDRDSREVTVLAPDFPGFCVKLLDHLKQGNLRAAKDDESGSCAPKDKEDDSALLKTPPKPVVTETKEEPPPSTDAKPAETVAGAVQATGIGLATARLAA